MQLLILLAGCALVGYGLVKRRERRPPNFLEDPAGRHATNVLHWRPDENARTAGNLAIAVGLALVGGGLLAL